MIFKIENKNFWSTRNYKNSAHDTKKGGTSANIAANRRYLKNHQREKAVRRPKANIDLEINRFLEKNNKKYLEKYKKIFKKHLISFTQENYENLQRNIS